MKEIFVKENFLVPERIDSKFKLDSKFDILDKKLAVRKDPMLNQSNFYRLV